MKLLIHRGAHQIGGSCVEIATKNTRIILDVGLPLEAFDSDGLKPKPSKKELIGSLAKVPGLFTPGQRIDAILLSHAHADHSGLLAYTTGSIPIYMTRGTSKMMMAGSVFARQSRIPEDRGRILAEGLQKKIGDMTITAFPVDHSSFGSVAFLIEADGRRVLYSGDLRNHGRKPGALPAIVYALKRQPLDALIMEGTHFERGTAQGKTEDDIEDDIVMDVRSHAGLALACFSPLNVDRLITFYKAANRTERTFVADPYTAFVLYLAHSHDKENIPDPFNTKDIAIHWPNIDERKGAWRMAHKLHAQMRAHRIPADAILANPSKYLMVFRPNMVDKCFAGVLPESALCIYSYWDGYLAKKDWVEMKNKVEKRGGRFVQHHTSGHIFTPDLLDFVKAMKPAVVLPIHTNVPHAFTAHIPNTRVLEDGKVFEVE